MEKLSKTQYSPEFREQALLKQERKCLLDMGEQQRPEIVLRFAM